MHTYDKINEHHLIFTSPLLQAHFSFENIRQSVVTLIPKKTNWLTQNLCYYSGNTNIITEWRRKLAMLRQQVSCSQDPSCILNSETLVYRDNTSLRNGLTIRRS